MKVAILSSAPAGGAGIAAYRIYEALKENTKFSIDFIDIALLGEVPHDVSPTYSGTNNRISNTHFTIDNSSDIRDWIVDYLMQYDLINVQWASYLISISEIMILAKNGKKILFTLHDFYYFTGGCHYPSTCQGFIKSCTACPQVDESKFSQVAVMDAYKLKRELFSYPNVHISAPSSFIVNSAIKSQIISKDRAHVLRNAYKSEEGFSVNDIDINNLSILLISDSFSEQRKGLLNAVEALNLAANSQPDLNLSVHLVGALDNKVVSMLDTKKITTYTHGHIKKHEELVKIYKKSRFILTSSYEDNWPNILVEGGCYGCIPIVGPGHGCEEFVSVFGFGGVSRSYSSLDFSNQIIKAIFDFKNNWKLSVDFSKKVREVHSFINASSSYLQVFDKINSN
jgi:glycosyltransferase involved in cell wall biosynthesis